MRNRILSVAMVAGLALAGGSHSVIAIQQAPAASAAKLPPVLYTCPMHPDVLEEKAGNCPVCKMQLEPIRIDSKWWCPVHQTLEVRDAPGKCRRDGRDLVQVTLSEFWTCPGSDNKLIDPGACGDGSPRRIKYEIRAHGDHNPRHGGQFFMAEDQWHHIEGTYPSAGLFRMYFYDNFTKPMDAAEFTGTFVILDQAFKEVASYPLKLGADGKTMEARIPADKAGLPLNGGARVAFGAGKKPQLFNFPFTAFTKEPTGAPAAAAAPAKPSASLGTPMASFAGYTPSHSSFSFRSLAVAAEASQAPAAQAPAQPPAAQLPNILDSPLQVSAELAAALDEDRLPKTVPDLLKELTTRMEEIHKLVQEGSLGQAWLPAMGTKTVALALDGKAEGMPGPQREAVSAAAKRIIASAWEIDAYGDLGNGEKIAEAYNRLASAVSDLKGAYSAPR